MRVRRSLGGDDDDMMFATAQKSGRRRRHVDAGMRQGQGETDVWVMVRRSARRGRRGR